MHILTFVNSITSFDWQRFHLSTWVSHLFLHKSLCQYLTLLLAWHCTHFCEEMCDNCVQKLEFAEDVMEVFGTLSKLGLTHLFFSATSAVAGSQNTDNNGQWPTRPKTV